MVIKYYKVSLFVIMLGLYVGAHGQDLQWAPKMIFNHDESNISMFEGKDPHTGLLEKKSPGSLIS